jgi:hypothetical protein
MTGREATTMPTMGLPVQDVSRDDIVREMERVARERLGMSAMQMVEAYCAGKLADPGVVADVLSLALLLDEDDALFVGAGSAPVPSR